MIKASKAAKGGATSSSFVGNMVSKLSAPVQGFIGSVKGAATKMWGSVKGFTASTWSSIKANGKRILYSSAAGAALVGALSFLVPKVAPVVHKITDCFTYQQTGGYFAIAKPPLGECLRSGDKDKDKTNAIGGNSIESIVKNGNKVEYTNPAGSKLQWFTQRPKDIDNAIKNGLNSNDVGKVVEAKVADFIRQQKEVISFGMKISKSNQNSKWENIGDIDVETEHEIIEVKRSLNAIKSKGKDKEDQFDKYINGSNDKFFNPYQKKVILYIEKPLGDLSPSNKAKIDQIKDKNVIVVNSLEELKEALK